ncbi:exostosin domain-containing protein [Alteromonas macleodii]|uniref:exostosin domain-containing protein n=1 Tax=Alteromonas macleodii TaxID=28108 RepID=UPI003BF81B9B
MIKESTTYPSSWVRHGNIFAYPYDWQQPAKTELWAYEQLLEKPDRDIYTQYICFPWATLVDYLDHNPVKAKELLKALDNRPPRFALNVKTFCQHIYALKLLPFFKDMGITEVYWSHKIKGQDEVEGIKLKPYPLYPVMHYKRKKPYRNKPLSERKYLYSFIGSYQPGLYLSDIRELIFTLPKREDGYIRRRGEWHFEQDVYRSQLFGKSEGDAESLLRQKHEDEYIRVMEDSFFSLCPSGSGPNSIRLWESVKFGCIPVLFGSELDLSEPSINKNLESVVYMDETKSSFLSLPEKLEKLRKEIIGL